MLGRRTTRIVYDLGERRRSRRARAGAHDPRAPARSPARPTSARSRRPASRDSSSASPTPTASGARSRRRSRPSPSRRSRGRPRSSTRAGSAAAGPSSTTRASRSGSTSRSSATRTRFEVPAAKSGSRRVLFYDAPGRLIRTRVSRRHASSRVEFSPWHVRPSTRTTPSTSRLAASTRRPLPADRAVREDRMTGASRAAAGQSAPLARRPVTRDTPVDTRPRQPRTRSRHLAHDRVEDAAGPLNSTVASGGTTTR